MARGESLHIGVNNVDAGHYNGWEGTRGVQKLSSRWEAAIDIDSFGLP